MFLMDVLDGSSGTHSVCVCTFLHIGHIVLPGTILILLLWDGLYNSNVTSNKETKIKGKYKNYKKLLYW